MLWSKNTQKFPSPIWTCLFFRKWIHLYQLCIFFLIIIGLYVTSSLYTPNEKVLSSQETNETSYTETAIVLNTETSNVIIKKQQNLPQVYERPALFNETVTAPRSFKIGDVVTNCGLPNFCDDAEFSVHIYTGKDHKDEPRLCIDSKYILTKSINNGGRGINFAVIDNMMKTIIHVGHFDTYEKDSTPLETLLLTLRPGDIVILFTFDEPSRKLSRIARLLLYDLGSALIQNLSYRGSWYLITQKGLTGFSPFEDLHLVENNGWPKHHDVRLCVPFQLKGQSVHPDPLPSSNLQRVQFCETNTDLPLFCDADVVNDPLIPSPVWKQPSAINKIYNVPILVMSGSNVQFLPLTLETLVRQPGLRLSLVVVYHLTKNKRVQNLSELFGFMSEELSQASSYCERVAEAFEITNLLFPDAKEIIFLGENAILSPDFLYYMGQLLSILNIDKSILAVSALNENGFKSVSSDPSLVYRTQSFSSLAILVRKEFFQRSWCNNNSIIDPLFISSEITGDVLAPDVSRVTFASPPSMLDSNDDVSSTFVSHDRTVTYEQNIPIKNPEKLMYEDYERELETLLTAAVPLEFDMKSLLDCLKNKESFQEKIHEDLSLFAGNTTNLSAQDLVIYFYQEHDEDLTTVQYLTQCFGLFYHPLYPVRGLYKGVLRFMLKENKALLVGSKSPFFHFKPRHVPVLRMDHHLGILVNTIM